MYMPYFARLQHLIAWLLFSTGLAFSSLHAQQAPEGWRSIPGKNLTIPDLALDLIWVAPGTFQMGSGDGHSDERPVRRVTHSRGFWLGKTEVTQAQWQAVMGGNPSGFKGDDLPVENVSYEDALAFCRKLTERERAAGRLPDGYVYTLPTEAQWEYACRAGTTGNYAGELDAMAWYGENSSGRTHPVGRKQANAWGLYDMHGNVWEWCLDRRGPYTISSATDPQGADAGSFRVNRGGGWSSIADHCRSANRDWDSPGLGDPVLGFRLALSFRELQQPVSRASAAAGRSEGAQ